MISHRGVYDLTLIRADQGMMPHPDSKMVVGAKQLRKALQRGYASRVYLAKNADPAITEPIETLCKQYDVPFAWVPNMMELGKQCGIEVGAAAAAAVR